MKKKHLREIRRITDSIPKVLLDSLTHKELLFPTLKEIATRGLQEPDSKVSKVDKAKFQAMLDSGYLDREHEVLNTDIEKQISDYLDIEFEKARKLGRLPPPQKFPKLKNKAKQIYVNNPNNQELVSLPEGENQGEDNR